MDKGFKGIIVYALGLLLFCGYVAVITSVNDPIDLDRTEVKQ